MSRDKEEEGLGRRDERGNEGFGVVREIEGRSGWK